MILEAIEMIITEHGVDIVRFRFPECYYVCSSWDHTKLSPPFDSFKEAGQWLEAMIRLHGPDHFKAKLK